MTKREKPTSPVTWYLKEWMDNQGMAERGSQARMMELTGWSKATMSQLYNGHQSFSPKILKEAAEALNVEPFELLIPPERAASYRKLMESAKVIVSIDNSIRDSKLVKSKIYNK